MKRKEICKLKRAVSGRNDAAAMHALLERSMRFGHTRLALKRCLQAERMGITLTHDILSYCRRVADDMAPQELEKLLLQMAPRADQGQRKAS
jgi:hypothetical protein